MKKILIIVPYNFFPPYWGAATRIYNLIKNLAQNNKILVLINNHKQLQKHDLNCQEFNELSSNPNIQIFFTKSIGKLSQIFNPLIIIKGFNIIKKEKPDFIMAENLWSGLHGIILKLIKNIPFFLDEHNVEFLRFERMKRGGVITRYFLKLYEKISCNSAYKIFCVSDIDKNFLISKLGIDKNKIVIVPNGIDTHKFFPNEQYTNEIRKQLKVSNELLILFFGLLSYIPNFEAIKIIHNKLLPLILKKIPNAKFLIVGDKPPLDFSHKNIIFTGLVKNIEDFINVSNVVICPLTSGGGTRFKILESIACGKVVVSTSIGAEGLSLKETKDFLKISDNWTEFSNHILASSSQKIKPNKEFIDKYSWKHSSLPIQKILENQYDKY